MKLAIVLAVLAFEAGTMWLFWRRLTVHGQGDGDIGLGAIFMLLGAIYLAVDLLAGAVMLLEWIFRGGVYHP